ncbi:hypothetical protein KFE98_17185 [bacterium SCSIO 12741]|nr:hypothetical protein KFE98_17185 [bacterium SCSIO 12741]
MKTPKNSPIQNRFNCFVQFISPDPKRRRKYEHRAKEIIGYIEKRLASDSYTLSGSTLAGSFAKKTGLRRHLEGPNEVEGLDIDLVFILKNEDLKGKSLTSIILVLEEYLRDHYPDSAVGHTKSSATISFKADRLSFDVVPLITTEKPGVFQLNRTDHQSRRSSVKEHTRFIQARTACSQGMNEAVHFNNCLRLVKWWRYQRQSEKGLFGNGKNDTKVPSFLLDLLCAKAFDRVKVAQTYPETLYKWFEFIQAEIEHRKPVLFTKHVKNYDLSPNQHWHVMDPLDKSNNVVMKWNISKIDELGRWFKESLPPLKKAILLDRKGEYDESLKLLVKLFGPSIKTYCKQA